jgi:hypothetical protein
MSTYYPDPDSKEIFTDLPHCSHLNQALCTTEAIGSVRFDFCLTRYMKVSEFRGERKCYFCRESDEKNVVSCSFITFAPTRGIYLQLK